MGGKAFVGRNSDRPSPACGSITPRGRRPVVILKRREVLGERCSSKARLGEAQRGKKEMIRRKSKNILLVFWARGSFGKNLFRKYSRRNSKKTTGDSRKLSGIRGNGIRQYCQKPQEEEKRKAERDHSIRVFNCL